jgi:DNA-directed RNA polymerase specialized sigma24 family protein
MLPLNPESTLDLSLVSVDSLPAAPRAADEEVLLLFDRHASSLLRYVGSFGLRADEAEDVVQEVFLALFRHLRLDRSRRHLTGWLFQVSHNLALKQRKRIQRRAIAPWDDRVDQPVDPAPNPEAAAAAHAGAPGAAGARSALPAAARGRAPLSRHRGHAGHVARRRREVAGPIRRPPRKCRQRMSV